jgi:hypothetical protein
MKIINLKKILSLHLTPDLIFQSEFEQLMSSLISKQQKRSELSSFVLNSLTAIKADEEKVPVQEDIKYALTEMQRIKSDMPESRLIRYVTMILRTAVKKLPEIRQDELIPKDTQKLLTKEIVFGSFVKMAAVKYSPEFEALIQEFEAISEEIGHELMKRGDDRGRHWNVRDRALWDWCRVLIEDTAHPSFFWLKENGHTPDSIPIKKFHDLFEALVKTVMWVSFPDDMADNYKHVRLTELFNTIPFASDSTLEACRSEISEIDGGLFSKYFNHAIKVWKSAEKDMQTIIGPKYETHKHELKENYKWICRSMLFSAKMNAAPIAESNVVNNEKHLQHNIMATSFNTLQTMLCLALMDSNLVIRFINPFTDSTFTTLMQIAQENARRSMNIATFSRGIFEGDRSNVMFVKINDWYCSPERDRSKYIVEIQSVLLAHQKVIARHCLMTDSRAAKTMTFFDLLSFRIEVERSLFNTYRKFDTEGKLIEFQKEYQNATNAIEKKLSTPDLEEIDELKALLQSMKKLILYLANESNIFRIYYREWESGRRAIIENVHAYSEKGELQMLQEFIMGWDKVHAICLIRKDNSLF